MPRFVVFSGLPASGKTSLADAIAIELAWPHLDKDRFLEALFEEERGGYSNELRTRLSRAADGAFQRAAAAAPVAVLTSWWRHPASPSNSGTDTGWLNAPGMDVVEVHCVIDPLLALTRFTRRQRHPGHMDHTRDPAALLSQFEAAAELGPLFPDRAIRVATDRPVDHAGVRELATTFRMHHPL